MHNININTLSISSEIGRTSHIQINREYVFNETIHNTYVHSHFETSAVASRLDRKSELTQINERQK